MRRVEVRQADPLYSNIFTGTVIPSKKKEKQCGAKINAQLNSRWFNILMTINIAYILFADDIRFIFFDKSKDIIFDSIYILFLLILLAQMILQSIVDKSYRNSFLFWMDTIALITSVLDVYLVYELVFNSIKNLPLDAAHVARAGRASRAGTRASRYLKFLRAIRVTKLARLYHQTKSSIPSRSYKRKDVAIRKQDPEMEARLWRRRKNFMICDQERRNSFIGKISRFYHYFIQKKGPGRRHKNSNYTAQDMQSQFGKEFSTKTANLKSFTERHRDEKHSIHSRPQTENMSIKSGMKRIDLMNHKTRNQSVEVSKQEKKAHTQRRKQSPFHSRQYLYENEYHSDRLSSKVKNQEKKDQSLKSGNLSKLDQSIRSLPQESYKEEIESVSSDVSGEDMPVSPVLIQIKQNSPFKTNDTKGSSKNQRKKQNLRDFVRRESKLEIQRESGFKWDLEEGSPQRAKKSQFSRNFNEWNSEHEISRNLVLFKYKTEERRSRMQRPTRKSNSVDESHSSVSNSRNNSHLYQSQNSVTIEEYSQNTEEEKEEAVGDPAYMQHNLKRIQNSESEYSQSMGFVSMLNFDQQIRHIKKHQGHQSRVGRKLSQLTTSRVIFLVLIEILFIPLFDYRSYQSSYMGYHHGIEMMEHFISANQPSTFQSLVTHLIAYNSDQLEQGKLMSIQCVDQSNPGFICSYQRDGPLYDDLRSIEVNSFESENVTILTDIRQYIQKQALMNFFRTLFICMVLLFGAFIVMKDANDWVIRPLEMIMDKVNIMAQKPTDIVALHKEAELAHNDASYELNTILRGILKTGELLALVFGEAGSRILRENISMLGQVKPMMPGKKIMAIFAFCDIRRFTDTTEVLQERIINFVNKVAHIVHSIAYENLGSPEKNYGDAFLLVWKIPESELIRNELSGNIRIEENSRVTNNLADLTVFAMAKIFARINRDPEILNYRHNPKLQERFNGNFRLKLGFGVHLGWCIEGVLGSNIKIDPSYMSVDVAIATMLEELTKTYAKEILMSGQFVDWLSEGVKEMIRPVDRVKPRYSSNAYNVYTLDLDPLMLIPQRHSEIDYEHRHQVENVHFETFFRSYQKRARIEGQMNDPNYRTAYRFYHDPEISVMRRRIKTEFIIRFKEAYDFFQKGQWAVAQEILIDCEQLQPEDGPSKALSNFMEQYGNEPPPGWNGVRNL